MLFYLALATHRWIGHINGSDFMLSCILYLAVQLLAVIFICVYSAFSWLYCVKFSFKLANIARSMTDVLGVHFLSGHSVVVSLFLLLFCSIYCLFAYCM